jgi:hypothetical protein
MSKFQILVLLLSAIVLPSLLVIGILFYKNIARKKYDKRFVNALEAQARLLNVVNSMVLKDVRGKLKVELSLEIQVLNAELYTTVSTWEIDITAIAYIQSGQTIAVKVDKDKKTTIYPNVSWATYWL